MKYKVIDVSTVEKMKKSHIYCSYLMFTCEVCNSKWGIRLDPGRNLTERDFICKACLFEETVNQKEREWEEKV